MKITVDTERDIVKEFGEGLSASAIARLHGLNCTTVTTALKKHGLTPWPDGKQPSPVRDNLKSKQEEIVAFHALYPLGATAENFGVSKATMHRFLKSIGIKIRPPGVKPKCFDHLPDDISAQWVHAETRQAMEKKPHVAMANHPTTKDILWLAGLLEGEGYFGCSDKKRFCPNISLTMTDRDVVERAGRLLNRTVYFRKSKKINRKSLYVCRSRGTDAISWMMTLYSEMGERRKEQIKEVIKKWLSSSNLPRGEHGQRLPALCHPHRLRRGHGLCSSCYTGSYKPTHRYNEYRKSMSRGELQTVVFPFANASGKHSINQGNQRITPNEVEVTP